MADPHSTLSLPVGLGGSSETGDASRTVPEMVPGADTSATVYEVGDSEITASAVRAARAVSVEAAAALRGASLASLEHPANRVMASSATNARDWRREAATVGAAITWSVEMWEYGIAMKGKARANGVAVGCARNPIAQTTNNSRWISAGVITAFPGTMYAFTSVRMPISPGM